MGSENEAGFIDISEIGLPSFDEVIKISENKTVKEPNQPSVTTFDDIFTQQQEKNNNTSYTEVEREIDNRTTLDDFFKTEEELMGKESTGVESEEIENVLEEIGNKAKEDSELNLTIDKDLAIFLKDTDNKAIIDSLQKGGIEGLYDYLISNELIVGEVDNVDFVSVVDNMNDDQLLMYDVEKKCKTCTTELKNDLFLRLRQANGSENYINEIRKDYVSNEKAKYETHMKAQQEQRLLEIKQENTDNLNKIKSIKNIGDFKNNDDIINKLTPFIQKDEKGLSPFLQELAEDPVKQYKAAFWAKSESNIQKHFKQKLEEAFKKGAESVLGKGQETKPRVTSSPNSSNKRKTKDNVAGSVFDLQDVSEDEFIDISEL